MNWSAAAAPDGLYRPGPRSPSLSPFYYSLLSPSSYH